MNIENKDVYIWNLKIVKISLHHKLCGKIFLVLYHQFYQVITQLIISQKEWRR